MVTKYVIGQELDGIVQPWVVVDNEEQAEQVSLVINRLYFGNEVFEAIMASKNPFEMFAADAGFTYSTVEAIDESDTVESVIATVAEEMVECGFVYEE